ncbi:MAG: RNA polymerase sigma factor, partial [Solirubrobacteraceae bacterium]
MTPGGEAAAQAAAEPATEVRQRVVRAPPPRASPPGAAAPRRLRLRSDSVLAERFANGDETAFAALYERHRRIVLAVCVGVLGNRDEAEDAAQECFASLAQVLREQAPRDLRAWLARVARNASIDLARRRRAPAMGELDVEAGDSRPAGTAGSRELPHEATRVGAELESVLAGIRELPETQRTALLMRELAGHSYNEIAALLGTDEQAVRGLIARARVGLREHRAASELPCAAARAAIALEPGRRIEDRTIRRHLKGCGSCRAYRRALRDDARALRALTPVMPAGGVAGTGAIAGLAAKGAFAGGAAGLSQLTAACAASICTVGAVVMLYPHRGLDGLQPPLPSARAAARTVRHPARAPDPARGHVR